MSEDILVTLNQKVGKNAKRWKNRMKNKVSIMMTTYKIEIKSALGLLSIVISFTAADHVSSFVPSTRGVIFDSNMRMLVPLKL